jgi:hypothetical protein
VDPGKKQTPVVLKQDLLSQAVGICLTEPLKVVYTIKVLCTIVNVSWIFMMVHQEEWHTQQLDHLGILDFLEKVDYQLQHTPPHVVVVKKDLTVLLELLGTGIGQTTNGKNN